MQPRKGGNKTRRKEKGVGAAIVAVVIVLVAVIAVAGYYLVTKSNEGGAGGGQGYPSESSTTLCFTDEQGGQVSTTRVLVDGVDQGSGSSISLTGLDLGSHTVIIYIGDAQFTKTFSFTGQDTIPVQLKSRITLNLSDEETDEPIDAIDVYVDDHKKGTTTQDGQLDLTNIAPGRHRVGLDVPGAQGMVERYITVGEEDQVALTIDMPNPSFVVTAEVEDWYDWWHLEEKGKVTVTLTNMGELPSEGTIAVVFVYRMDRYEKIAERTITFGQIPPYPQSGSSISDDTGEMSEFVWGPTEEAVVIVVDKSNYIPEDEQGITRISNSVSVVGQALRDAIEWVRNNPEIIGKIARIFVGDALDALL